MWNNPWHRFKLKYQILQNHTYFKVRFHENTLELMKVTKILLWFIMMIWWGKLSGMMGSVRWRRWSIFIFWIILIWTSETDGQKSLKETAEKITKILKKDGSTLKPKLLTGKKSQRQIKSRHSQYHIFMMAMKIIILLDSDMQTIICNLWD